MAKKNAREEPPKPQVTENEQMSDIVFILDKMELILEAVSQIGKDGKFNTVAADRQHRNSFLKIDRYADAFENFIKNFWSQLKRPDTLRNPLRQGRQAGRPCRAAGHRGHRRRKEDKSRGRISQAVRDCSAQQGKPKYQPKKSRRNGKEK